MVIEKVSISDDRHSKIKTYDHELSTDPCLQNTFGIVFKYYKLISAVAKTFRLFFFNLAQILTIFAKNCIKKIDDVCNTNLHNRIFCLQKLKK